MNEPEKQKLAIFLGSHDPLVKAEAQETVAPQEVSEGEAVSEAGGPGPNRLEESGIPELPDEVLDGHVVGHLQRVRPHAADEVRRPVERRPEEAHEGVAEVGGHGLLRPALRVLQVVGLARAAGRAGDVLLLHQPAVARDGDGEDEPDDVVVGVAHRRNQI